MGFRVVVLTNQSVVGKGIIDERRLKEIHMVLFKQVEEAGGRIDRIYFCPHRPEDDCFCRKPKTGLFNKAASDLGINLIATYYIGDKESDIIAARSAGCMAAFGGEENTVPAVTPDIVARGLSEAVEKILITEQ